MIRLGKSLSAWGAPDFESVLKEEIRQMGAEQLPLQQGLLNTSYALDDKLDVRVISVSDEPGFIHAKVGIFYAGILAGCSCADDPTPVEEQAEYCEVQLDINKMTAEAEVTLLR